MVTKQISVNIVEHASTRDGIVMFRRNSSGLVECLVQVELEQADSESFIVDNSVLTDGSSILTTQERQNLFATLKKIYDYARDNLPGSTP